MTRRGQFQTSRRPASNQPVRQSDVCPTCRTRSALFYARSGPDTALYRCRDDACGAVHERTHPEPL